MRRGRERARTTPFSALLLILGCAIQPPLYAQPAPPPPANAEPAPAPVSEDEQQALALLAELQRYAVESPEELRRELVGANQAVNRVRSEANRIRLAVLLTMPGAGPTDDARALALLDSVIGKTGGTSPVRQLATVLYLQIGERARNVAEDKKKTAAAQEQLDQLRAVERSLLIERSRNAGGAGGGGGGGPGR